MPLQENSREKISFIVVLNGTTGLYTEKLAKKKENNVSDHPLLLTNT
jgi:hypothetical protein